MSEIEQTETTTNETTNEATDEVKEIEIPIEEKKQEVSVVKDISKLTLEERAKIITDARNGIPNEHYDVILLKNGNTRIVKKKNKTPTQSVASRLISQTQNNQTPTPNKIYMSDTQIMMEHIIELNNQVNKLMTKQKKLKKKYKTLKYDIYEDVDENQITQEPKQEPKQEQIKQEPTQEPTQETKQETAQDVTQETKQDTAQDIKPSYRTAGIRVLPQKGWRSYISYL